MEWQCPRRTPKPRRTVGSLLRTRTRRVIAAVLILIITIGTSVINFFLNTVPENEDSDAIYAVEIACTAVFTLEAVVRTYVGTLDPKRMILKDYWCARTLSRRRQSWQCGRHCSRHCS